MVGRTDPSIEFKHSNISAVLVERGQPYIDGYKPRGNYQRMLGDEGFTVVKLFLNVSKEEQRLRFQDRIDDPEEIERVCDEIKSMGFQPNPMPGPTR